MEQLRAILGVEKEEVVDTQWIDNGPGWVGVLLDSAQSVLALRPDASKFPGRWDIGVIGAHPERSEKAFEVRGFFTEGEDPLREDPVTGSLNASAAQWLIKTGRATAPYVAAQGGAMGRNGEIFITSVDDQVWVGGRAEVVLSGVAKI
ncbi:PhzF family phenazine biosynthesis protein [Glutamicibacter sp. AOP5-A2-18]|uniref:PhzF family phenazine biosynthesis protein n=1 Tax=Glutamicibacter sp. AOP5-A2-18 TaxID=3457656 RepID=UPI004033B8BC